MPNSHLVAIDHLLTYVTSLDEAAALFSRMGFRLSPISHIEAMGVANHVVLMRPRHPGRANYIELMTPLDRSKLPPQMASVLSGDCGIGSMVLVATAIEELPRLIADIGFSPTPLAHVRREWVIPGEESVFPEFDVMLPVEAPLRFNACRYRNVELYLREEWLDHPNGAQRLSAVYAVAPQPSDFKFFEAILATPARTLPGGGLCFSTGDVRLEILSAAEVAHWPGLERRPLQRPRYLGYEIEVTDLDELRARFDRERVPYCVAADGRTYVEPDIGLGNYIVFAPAGGE